MCARISEQRGRPDATPATQAPAVAVEDLYAELRDGPLASVRVEMLHGQLPAEEKDAVMGRFVAGEIACWSPPR